MKTLKDFFENYSSNPDLHKKVWRQGSVDFSDVKEYPNDYYDASSGSVSGMIYYSDTVKFAKRNAGEILLELNRFENECGVLTNKPTEDETQYFNWLSWFAWESMMGELIAYLED